MPPGIGYGKDSMKKPMKKMKKPSKSFGFGKKG